MVPRVNIMLLAAIIVGSFVVLIVLLEHGDYAGLGRGSVLDSFLAATHTKHLQDEPPFRRLQNVPTGHILATSPQSAISGHHFNHSISHKRAWMHLDEVDGLKNEEVVMVVTSTVTREGYFLRERCAISVNTQSFKASSIKYIRIQDYCELTNLDASLCQCYRSY